MSVDTVDNRNYAPPERPTPLPPDPRPLARGTGRDNENRAVGHPPKLCRHNLYGHLKRLEWAPGGPGPTPECGPHRELSNGTVFIKIRKNRSIFRKLGPISEMPKLTLASAYKDLRPPHVSRGGSEGGSWGRSGPILSLSRPVPRGGGPGSRGVRGDGRRTPLDPGPPARCTGPQDAPASPFTSWRDQSLRESSGAISRFQDFKIQDFRISRFQGSRFQDFKI